MSWNPYSTTAEDGGRTRTVLTYRRILSPVRLPVPPPRHDNSVVNAFSYVFPTRFIRPYAWDTNRQTECYTLASALYSFTERI